MSAKGKKQKKYNVFEEKITDDKVKIKVTILLDLDMLKAAKAEASKKNLGYQTLINQVLREHFLNQGARGQEGLIKAAKGDVDRLLYQALISAAQDAAEERAREVVEKMFSSSKAKIKETTRKKKRA